MKISTYLLCSTLPMILHASTITNVTARVFYTTPQATFGPVECNQADPSSASCNLNYPNYSMEALSSATAVDWDITAKTVAGVSVVGANSNASAIAGFADTYTFTPSNNQDAIAQVQYSLFMNANSGDDNHMEVTFNGDELFDGHDAGGHNPITITAPYSGGAFNVGGAIEADVTGTNEGDGLADVELVLRNITMLDANGQVVAGTLDPVPEPAFWPATGLTGFALVLLGKRRVRAHMR